MKLEKIWLIGLVVLGIIVVGVIGGVTWREFYIPKLQPGAEQANVLVQPTPSPTPEIAHITLTAVGDIMLGRSVQEQMEKRGSFTWPFELVAERLKNADITIGNLEAVIVPNCTQKENRFIFCAKPEAMEGLTMAGFDIVSQANNHSYNYGKEAYQESITLLREKGMEVTDPTNFVVKEIKGVSVGFLGYDDVTSTLDLSELGKEVAIADAKVDVLVPVVHWGIEYVDQPVPRQREVAKVMLDNGADIIIGSHPHWKQPAERIGNSLVFWSLGNFVFDQMWSEETRQGQIAEIQITKQETGEVAYNYQLVPVRIYDYGQPNIVKSQ